ncbi:MAG TPA: L,D-transpeptidase family protein [Candidatus Limnocylindria bacterium]|nr:L,D-transpeptidase family protein [Candidatus Limnocylindria bacterium]
MVVLAGLAVVFASASASLTGDPQALAKVSLPLGGGSVQSIMAVTGPHSRRIPITIRDGRIWPRGTIPAGERVSLEVVVKRPSWIAWLAGHTQRLRLTVATPTARLAQDYLTVARGAPLAVRFTSPVSAVAYGPNPGRLTRRRLVGPQSLVTLARSASAGSLWIAATPRSWETAKPESVSWFPAGQATAAVATPAPGSTIGPGTPIRLSFARPIAQALGGSMPPVSPATAGSWHTVDSHTIVFRPEGYGYGIGAHVVVGLPAGVRLVGGSATGSADHGVWTVPPGSTLRLQQLLSMLGYLPLRFNYGGAHPASTPTGEETAAIHPPSGSFSWRYQNVPSDLRSMWAPGADGVMTRGAVMAFENDRGLTADGVAGPQVWRTLISAALTGRGSGFGYTFVMVDKAAQHLTLWHSGRTVLTTLVNTGIASAPTASGTFPVYEHIRVGTMSGTNPDGSHYNDPGIQFISYFNGGDALHAFTRAQYGFPQSLGCVEMALGPAGQVWPYTPIGTLVHVA